MCFVVLFFFLFFFFQAEDGIRDHCVTGVQTCALPISARSLIRERAGGGNEIVIWKILGALAEIGPAAKLAVPGLTDLAQVDRSEERRVGKECRSRWSLYHKKKKIKKMKEVNDASSELQ